MRRRGIVKRFAGVAQTRLVRAENGVDFGKQSIQGRCRASGAACRVVEGILRSGPIYTVLKLLALSLVVGLVLHWLDLTPLDLVENLGQSARRFFAWLRGFMGWAVDYVVMGAMVVVPIWLIMLLIGRLRR